MTAPALLRPTARPSARPAATRDTAVDLARVACLLVVVLLHAMMVGVSAPGGVPLLENAMESWEWFAPATWIVQVMPLFFVLGGFSSYTDWTRRREAGESAAAYVVQRVQRLAVPALAAIAATGVFLSALAATGVAPEVVAVAGFRSSQPLWFLGVYLLCSALVPLAVAAHRRAPRATVAVLGACVLLVDAGRAASGIDAVGFANLLFVWLLVQQLGFFLADGSLSALGRRAVRMRGLVALAALIAAVAVGVWPGDLFAALNPPTGALVLLGMVQLCAFELLRPALRRAHEVPAVRRTTAEVGARSMTVYAWHMPVLIALAGALLVLPIELPVPLSAAWWESRPLWLITAGIAVALVARAAGRAESARLRGAGARPGRAVVVVVIAALGVVAVLLSGSSPAGWFVGAAALAASIGLSLRSARREVSAAR